MSVCCILFVLLLVVVDSVAMVTCKDAAALYVCILLYNLHL